MRIGGRISFDHMRYVMAIQGSIALALLFLMKHNESAAIQYYYKHNRSTADAHFCILAACFAISFTIGVLSSLCVKKLSAKWIMSMVMTFHGCQYILCTSLYGYGDQFFHIFAIVSSVTHVISPCVLAVAMHRMIAQWSPPDERSVITAFVYCGVPAATAYATMSTIPDQTLPFVCITWLILWGVTINESPEDQMLLISQNEKDYIRTSLASYSPRASAEDEKSLCKILFSMPFISVVLVECCNTLILSALLIQLPSLLFKQEKQRITIIKCLGQAINILVYGIKETLCLKQKTTTFDQSRKHSAIGGICLPLWLSIIAYSVKMQEINIIAYFTIGPRFSGAIVNIIDMSPKDAAFLMAIVQISNHLTMLISYPLVEHVANNFGYYDAVMIVIIPITLLAFVVLVLYVVWGSTAQVTTTSGVYDPAEGRMYSDQELLCTYGPLEEPAKEPLRF